MPIVSCVSTHSGNSLPMPSACVLALGSFDGVHLAHRALLSRAKSLRDGAFADAACGAFCFLQPPADLLLGNAAPKHLCTLEQKLEHFASCGIEIAILADFSALQSLSPDAFVKEILQEQCHAVAAVCGFNYRFGKNGKGDANLLGSLMPFTEVQAEIRMEGDTVSSTRIRSLLTKGDVERAARLLSYSYTLRATVLHGKALGRKLGTPTINQAFPDKALIPSHGVYLTRCRMDGIEKFGVSNVGVRPTVENNAHANCETYLLDFSGDLYGKTVDVSFLKMIRPEIKFSSKEELIAQIELDEQAARRMICDGDLF